MTDRRFVWHINMAAEQFHDYSAAFEAIVGAVPKVSTVVGKQSGAMYIFAVSTCVSDAGEIEESLRAVGIEGAVQRFRSASGQ